MCVGNYYSLRNEHDRAVVYFRRAVRANPDYLAAWTLMGHEYLELGNAHAALDAYRHALDINPRDYRAYFGLGQTYEMLKMATFAREYFVKAVKLRPGDQRMWMALGGVLEALEDGQGAVDCYKRVVGLVVPKGLRVPAVAAINARGEDTEEDGEEGEGEQTAGFVLEASDVSVIARLAAMLKERGDTAQALRYYRLLVAYAPDPTASASADNITAGEVLTEQAHEALIEAWLFLARHYAQLGWTKEAEACVGRLSGFEHAGWKDEVHSAMQELQWLITGTDGGDRSQPAQ